MNIRIILVFFFLLFSFNVSALDVAIIDFRVAILQSNAGQAAAKEPQAQIVAMEEQLKKEQAELKELSAALKRDELTLSKDEFNNKQRELSQRSVALRNSVANMQQQAKQMEQQLLEKLKPQAEAILKEMIEEKSLQLVLNRQVSVYSAAGVDITNELSRRMNESK